MNVTSGDAWRNPPLSCDIVMKGGITSGVVYPGAVMKRACGSGASAARRRARSRRVAAAAAEHGRSSGGFERLAVRASSRALSTRRSFHPRDVPAKAVGARALSRGARLPALRRAARPDRRDDPLVLALPAPRAHARRPRGRSRGGGSDSVTVRRRSHRARAVDPRARCRARCAGSLGAIRAERLRPVRLRAGSGRDTVLTVWLHRLVQHLCGRAPSREVAAGTAPAHVCGSVGASPLREARRRRSSRNARG